MRALIIGSSGFVGSHLVEHLRACGDRVLGVTRAGAVTAADPPLAAWDITAEPSASARSRIEAFAPEAIYHLSAVSIPRDCGDTVPTAAAVAVNVDGTRRVLDLACSLRPRPRVVFLSSRHVYAPVEPEHPLVDESWPLAPQSAYGKTKLAAEELCRAAAVRDGLDVVVVRSFPQSGPRMDPRLMLAEWADQVVADGEGAIDVQSLDVTIDFLDVRDAVRALRLIAERGAAGEAYNLGSGVPRTTSELFHLLCERAGVRRPVRELRPGRRSDPIADVAKLRAATDWTPQIDAAQTVVDVLNDRRRRRS